MQFEVGNILEGKVSGITNFGAFILLDEGKTGLVHISEVASAYVENINDHLKVNDSVKVKVLSIDDKGKISLSIKKAAEPAGQQPAQQRPARPARPPRKEAAAPGNFGKKPMEPLTFEDKMKQFMQSSDERMQDLKRSVDSKRGGGGYKRSF